MFVVLRYRIGTDEISEFLNEAQAAIDVLSTRRGFIRGSAGQALDEAGLMTLLLEFEDVGTYRRALSNYDVKLTAVPLLSRAIDEPSAFELLHSKDRNGTVVNEQSALAIDGPRLP